MFSKFVLFIGVVSLMKYLKCDVGSSFASVTYIIGRIAPMIHLLGVRWCRVFFFRLAIFLKGFATREVEDCQELSFTHFDLEVVIRLKQKFVLPVASRLEGQITMYENL